MMMHHQSRASAAVAAAAAADQAKIPIWRCHRDARHDFNHEPNIVMRRRRRLNFPIICRSFALARLIAHRNQRQQADYRVSLWLNQSDRRRRIGIERASEPTDRIIYQTSDLPLGCANLIASSLSLFAWLLAHRANLALRSTSD